MSQRQVSGSNGGRATLTRNVAPGIHRLEHAYVNCYLVEQENAVTVVDAAHPRTWPLLQKALSAIGRSSTDVRALVLTHAHFDHLGFAKRAMEEWGVPVWAHRDEAHIARHPYRYAHENPRLIYPIEHPRAIPLLGAMTAAGALTVQGMDGLHFYEPGAELDVPGSPRIIHVPGHTLGSAALHFPARSTLIVGDALVTLDPYTGGRGPQIVSGAATADSTRALASLGLLLATEARVVLPGHGEPWREGIRSAVALAQASGPS